MPTKSKENLQHVLQNQIFPPLLPHLSPQKSKRLLVNMLQIDLNEINLIKNQRLLGACNRSPGIQLPIQS